MKTDVLRQSFFLKDSGVLFSNNYIQDQKRLFCFTLQKKRQAKLVGKFLMVSDVKYIWRSSKTYMVLKTNIRLRNSQKWKIKCAKNLQEAVSKKAKCNSVPSSRRVQWSRMHRVYSENFMNRLSWRKFKNGRNDPR